MTKHKLSTLITTTAFAVALAASLPAFAESAGQYIDDATITTKVKAALMGDSQLKATKVSVTTDQGVVHLTGDVASKSQETQAVNDANKVSGVKSVKDQLSVNGQNSNSMQNYNH